MGGPVRGRGPCMSGRKWHRSFKFTAAALVVMAAGLGFVWLEGEPPEELDVTMAPAALRQVVGADNRNERTIMWQGDTEEPIIVEYRKTGSMDIKGAQSYVQWVEGNQGEPDRYVYEAYLKELEPGEAYEYRTRAGRRASPWYAFTADDGGPFKALIFPDTQCADYSVWAGVAAAGLSKAPDAELFIMMGDLVDCGQDEHQWQSWMQGAQGLFRTMPIAPIMGNHEAYSLNWQMAEPDRFLTHFALPTNGDTSMPELFYSFDWGPVHFAVLNTQMQELAEWYPDLLEKQQAWLEKDLARTEQPWKVVLMHKDVLQYRIASRPERQEGFSPEGDAFMPIFDRAGVDAVLTAHLHTYRNRGHIRHFQRDGGGPLYILTGVAGDVRYPNLWTDHALDVTVAPQPETDNFLTMEADEHTIIFRAWLPDGTQIDEAVLEK